MKGLGIFLMIAGGACDLIQIFMSISDPFNFEAFNTLTVIGTIAFIVGLFLFYSSGHAKKM